MKILLFSGSIYFGIYSRLPIVVHRLQLPESIRILDWNACRYVLLLVLRFLQTSIHQETKSKFRIRQRLKTNSQDYRIEKNISRYIERYAILIPSSFTQV